MVGGGQEGAVIGSSVPLPSDFPNITQIAQQLLLLLRVRAVCAELSISLGGIFNQNSSPLLAERSLNHSDILPGALSTVPQRGGPRSSEAVIGEAQAQLPANRILWAALDLVSPGPDYSHGVSHTLPIQSFLGLVFSG